jgi:hypothetical protein
MRRRLHGIECLNCRARLTVSNGSDTIGLMYFEIVGGISEVETFATGSEIREIARLRRVYGRGRRRKRKGIARIRLADGSVHLAEVPGTKPLVSDARNSS